MSMSLWELHSSRDGEMEGCGQGWEVQRAGVHDSRREHGAKSCGRVEEAAMEAEKTEFMWLVDRSVGKFLSAPERKKGVYKNPTCQTPQ